MYQIKTFNRISTIGLNRFDPQCYRVSEDTETPDGIVVRSAKLAAGESITVCFESAPSEQFPNADLMIFCGEGKATVTLGEEKVVLEGLHSALVKNAVGLSVTVEAAEDAAFMIAEVQI